MSVQFQKSSSTVTLRNPELGNSDRTSLGTAIRQVMSGDYHTYKSTPNHEVRLMNFVESPCGEVDEFKTFLKQYAGQEIDFTDHEGFTYSGYILNNPFTFENPAKDTTTFTIEFAITTLVSSPIVPSGTTVTEGGSYILTEDDEDIVVEGE